MFAAERVIQGESNAYLRSSNTAGLINYFLKTGICHKVFGQCSCCFSQLNSFPFLQLSIGLHCRTCPLRRIFLGATVSWHLCGNLLYNTSRSIIKSSVLFGKLFPNYE